MPIMSSSAPSNGRARSAISSSSPPTTRSPPGAGGCSTCSAASPARAPPMAAERWPGRGGRDSRADPACAVGRRLGRRHVLRPSGAAARRRGARPGAAAIAVVARPRPVLRLGDRRDRPAAGERLHPGVRGVRRLCRGRPSRPSDAGDRHPDDAAFLPPLFRAVDAVSAGGGAPGLGRGRPSARPDPHDRDDQPGARPHRRRDRQQRALLGVRTGSPTSRFPSSGRETGSPGSIPTRRRRPGCSGCGRAASRCSRHSAPRAAGCGLWSSRILASRGRPRFLAVGALRHDRLDIDPLPGGIVQDQGCRRPGADRPASRQQQEQCG